MNMSIGKQGDAEKAIGKMIAIYINSFLGYCANEGIKDRLEMMKEFANIDFAGNIVDRFGMPKDVATVIDIRMTLIVSQLFLHELLQEVAKVEFAENGKFDCFRADGSKIQ